MTDILPSMLQFVLWAAANIAIRYDWSLKVRLLVCLPIVLVMIAEFVVPLEFALAPAIGHPINIGLRVVTLGLIVLFFLEASRKSARRAAIAAGSE